MRRTLDAEAVDMRYEAREIMPAVGRLQRPHTAIGVPKRDRVMAGQKRAESQRMIFQKRLQKSGQTDIKEMMREKDAQAQEQLQQPPA